MVLLYLWIYYIIIGTILLIGKAISCRALGIYGKHYQIGYSPSFTSFRILNVNFSIGIIIPLPFLFKIYEIKDTEKRKLKPIWILREHSFIKRLGAIMGGLGLLYIVIIVLYAINYYTTDSYYLSADNINKDGVYVDSLGQELGFRTGDKIISIEGNPYERFSELKTALLLENAKHFIVIRNGAKKEITINNEDIIAEAISYNSQILYPIRANYPIKIDAISANKPAYEAGLKKGDEIYTVNGDTFFCSIEFTEKLQKHKNSSVILGIKRDDEEQLRTFKVNTDPTGRIGIYIQETLQFSTEDKHFGKSLNAGNESIHTFFQQFYMPIKRNNEGFKQTRGFYNLRKVFPETFPFWNLLLIALLSYFCLSMIPSPITETRHIVALIIDQFIKLPQTASLWISLIIFAAIMLLFILINIIRFFALA